MNKSVWIRVMTALSGVALLLASAAAVGERFFGITVSAWAGRLFAAQGPWMMLLTLVVILLLAVLGVSCILVLLPGRKPKKRGYVMQKTENGPIGISVKTIEGQIRTCVQKHDVIARADISVAEGRTGLIILLTVDQAAGVNIPLSVGMLQKQIRQYVSACSGIEVQEVRVLVENSASPVPASPFAVPQTTQVGEPETEEKDYAEAAGGLVMSIPAEEAADEAETEDEPAPEAQEIQAAVLPEIPPTQDDYYEDTDERPLHQRLFGAEEELAIVPKPPEMTAQETQTEAAGETALDEADTAEEEEKPAGDADDIDWSAHPLPVEDVHLMTDAATRVEPEAADADAAQIPDGEDAE